MGSSGFGRAPARCRAEPLFGCGSRRGYSRLRREACAALDEPVGDFTMSDFPTRVVINEDGPREGFQIESATIPTDHKVELIDALSETGLQEIQIASFVHPKRVPGMADAEEVVRRVKMREDVRYTGLFLNEKGLRRAMATGRLTLTGNIGLTASETFLMKNQNSTFEQQKQSRRDMARLLQNEGITIRSGSVNAAFGCNFEGDIPLDRLLATADAVFELADELGVKIESFGLSDTMAWATPRSIRAAIGALRDRHPDLQFSLHLHDTRGLAMANALAGLEMGVSEFAASKIGRASCRERVWQYAYLSVVAEHLKKKTKK